MLILIEKFSKQIRSYNGEDELGSDNDTKEDRIAKFQNEYTAQVNILMKRWDSFKVYLLIKTKKKYIVISHFVFSQDFLSVRQLLQLNERLLKKYGFTDVWRLQKLEENSKALTLLSTRLEKVAAISDPRQRWENLFTGLLASNIFDSGKSW